MPKTTSFIATFFCLLITIGFIEAKPPQLTPDIVKQKIEEITRAHATHKELTTEIIKRALQNEIEEFDPNKTYFIYSDIQPWLEPTQEQLQDILAQYRQGNFAAFGGIYDAMIRAIARRRALEAEINLQTLPTNVHIKEFKKMAWVKTPEELLDRLRKIKSVQVEASKKLNEEVRDKALHSIAKRQAKYEDELLNPDPMHRQMVLFVQVLKAISSALDTHTAYFTPDEAKQFLITVQQRLLGIGALLKDDLNGFTVIKIVEGSPAALGKELKVKDRIIAVDGEPVVGLDIVSAVDLIRGEEGTAVTLTVIRENKEENGTVKEQQLNIQIKRGPVVFKEARYDSSYEPFADGSIGYVRLNTFYQDPEFSSASDIADAINTLKKEHHLKGLILDLRSNSGGLLAQAVDVAGLFITKGTIVSVKDHTAAVQHLRDLDGKMTWDGPLLILVNRASASSAEIVAQSLQDYGRALLVGDDHTFGKGTFQTFTLNSIQQKGDVNPQGEYKVTRGKYYTVSGKTPQLTGVAADIVVPGVLSEMEIGEKYTKYPLENDRIKSNFDDDLSDIPFTQRDKIRLLYKFDLQPKLNMYAPYLKTLQEHSTYRLSQNSSYQKFLKKLKEEEGDEELQQEEEDIGFPDFQLIEAYNIMKELLLLMQESDQQRHGAR